MIYVLNTLELCSRTTDTPDRRRHVFYVSSPLKGWPGVNRCRNEQWLQVCGPITPRKFTLNTPTDPCASKIFAGRNFVSYIIQITTRLCFSEAPQNCVNASSVRHNFLKVHLFPRLIHVYQLWGLGISVYVNSDCTVLFLLTVSSKPELQNVWQPGQLEQRTAQDNRKDLL